VIAHPLVDDVLERFRDALGPDAAAYRGHAHRMLNYTLALVAADAEARDRLAVAAAFHDLGIWTAGTFDYLEPSVRLAVAWLDETGRGGWREAVSHAIRAHHALLPLADPEAEAFRRGDLADLSWGAVRPGVPRDLIRETRARWPNAGFHRCLLRVGVAWARRHPLRPLPMLRLRGP